MSFAGYYKELKSEWNKRSPNLARCSQLLDSVKLDVMRAGFISAPEEAEQPQKKQLLTQSREMLEIAVHHSIKVMDYGAFERYMAQLNMYYYDYEKYLKPSSDMYKYKGLHLLYMLANNRIADFHIELERLPSQALLNNEYIKPVLALENYFMEGRYNKILQAKKSLPSSIYNNVMDKLIQTSRDEIASCMEASYEKIQSELAANRLGLKLQSNEMKELVKKRKWVLDPKGNYDFTGLKAKQREFVLSTEIASQTLTYAQELEKIV